MTAQSMNYTVVINGAVWGGALAYYYIDARKWFTGTIFDYLPHFSLINLSRPPPNPCPTYTYTPNLSF